MNNETKRLYDVKEINNFRELLQNTVSSYPDNVAYKFKKFTTEDKFEYVEKTYSEFNSDIQALSTSLIDMGLEEKKIAVIGDNSYNWCISYLAVATGNMIVIPLDKALPEKELESLVIRSEADMIIFDKKYAEIIKRIKSEGKSNLKYLVSMQPLNETEIIDYGNMLTKGKELLKNNDKRYENIKIDKDKMSVQLFTSGTTNEPKAVMLSQYNICSNIVATASYVKMYPTDTLLSFLPIHHTFECTITFLYGIYYGVTVAFCDGLKYIQKNLQEYKVSVFVAVPLVLETMYKKIQKGIEEKGKTKLINIMSKISNFLLKCKIDLRKVIFKQILDNFGGNLRVVFYGAAPMDKSTIIGFNNLGIKLLQGYGLTETSPVITCETDEKQRPGSVGLPLYNIEVKVDNPDNDGVGEIIVKGPSVMMGYYKNEEETKKALKDGWFYTGDYGYIDNDGFIYVTGRKKDVIVLKNGKNIYPQEIEFLINKLPYVKESIVYQRGKNSTDTMLCSKIVYDADIIKDILGDKKEEEYQEIIWNEIKEINKTLPVFKHIKNINITTEELAKTTTQKVKRYEELKKVEA